MKNMREIDVHEFHRRVIADAEPRFHPLRAAAAVVAAGKSRVTLTDWGVWTKAVR